MRMLLAALLCLLSAACSAQPPADGSTAATEPAATELAATEPGATEPGATDACGPVETIPVQGEGHLVGDQDPPVPYNSTPPTSGWHTSGDVAFSVYGPDDALREPEQVTVLELGGVVVSYNGLPEAEVSRLADLVSGEHAGRAALTPYDQLGEGEVAMTAWGKVQVCDSVDPAAIAAFVDAYAEAAG